MMSAKSDFRFGTQTVSSGNGKLRRKRKKIYRERTDGDKQRKIKEHGNKEL